MSAAAYFKAVIESYRTKEAKEETTKAAEFHLIPGLANSMYVRTVRKFGHDLNWPGSTDSQYAVLLRGGRTVVLLDVGYGGYTGSGPLGYVPRSIFYKIAAQVR